MVLLITSDNEQIAVDRDIAERSAMIRATLEAIGESDQPITLQNVPSRALKKVLEYCEYHKGEPLPPTDAGSRNGIYKRRGEIVEWDQKFIAVDPEMLFEILIAANNLEIKPLRDISAEAAFKIAKGKTLAESRDIFSLP